MMWKWITDGLVMFPVTYMASFCAWAFSSFMISLDQKWHFFLQDTSRIYTWHFMSTSHFLPAWYIKTHGCVLAAKKAMWRTSVLFTGTTNSPFSAPHISVTTGPISIKFTCYVLHIHDSTTKFEGNWPSSLWDMWSWKLPHFLHLFLLLRTILQK